MYIFWESSAHVLSISGRNERPIVGKNLSLLVGVEDHQASVVMHRLPYPTETVLSNNITRNWIVLSFKDCLRKPLRRRSIIPSFCRPRQTAALAASAATVAALWLPEIAEMGARPFLSGKNVSLEETTPPNHECKHVQGASSPCELGSVDLVLPFLFAWYMLVLVLQVSLSNFLCGKSQIGVNVTVFTRWPRTMYVQGV